MLTEDFIIYLILNVACHVTHIDIIAFSTGIYEIFLFTFALDWEK